MALREPVRSSATITVLRQAFWLCLILASLHLLSISAKSQITIVRIVKDKVALKEPTNEVTCIRKKRRPPVTAKMTLEVGDKLYSESRSIKLEVNCGGATYLFTAPLSVNFRKPTGAGCFIGYSSDGGKVNVISRNTPTNNQIGYHQITSQRTAYEIRTFREEPNRLARLLLFRSPRLNVQALAYVDGIEVKSGQFSETLKQGQKVTLSNRGAPIIERVNSGDFLDAARVLTEFDVSQMPTTDPAERQRAFDILVPLQEAVLRQPENSQSRIELDRELKNLGIAEGDVTPSPSPPIQTPPAEKAESQSNEWTKAEVEVNNLCKKPHKFRITPQGLQFPHRPLSIEITVLQGATHKGPFEFDMAAVGPGVYHGKWFIECLDCRGEPRCTPVKQGRLFKLKK